MGEPGQDLDDFELSGSGDLGMEGAVGRPGAQGWRECLLSWVGDFCGNFPRVLLPAPIRGSKVTGSASSTPETLPGLVAALGFLSNSLDLST